MKFPMREQQHYGLHVIDKLCVSIFKLL